VNKDVKSRGEGERIFSYTWEPGREKAKVKGKEGECRPATLDGGGEPVKRVIETFNKMTVILRTKGASDNIARKKEERI